MGVARSGGWLLILGGSRDLLEGDQVDRSAAELDLVRAVGCWVGCVALGALHVVIVGLSHVVVVVGAGDPLMFPHRVSAVGASPRRFPFFGHMFPPSARS